MMDLTPRAIVQPGAILASARCSRQVAWRRAYDYGMNPFPALPREPLAALLAAVADEPDADEPRLVLADLLDDHGDPRADFLRIGCELARLDPRSARHFDLTRASRAWLRQYGQLWLGEPEYPFLFAWDRGLPGLRVNQNNFGDPPALQTGWLEAIRRNLEQGWIPRLDLHVSDNEEASEAARGLEDPVVARRLRQFTGLHLGQQCTESSLRALAPLVWVRSLSASLAMLDDVSMRHLQGMKQLRELELAGPGNYGPGYPGVTGLGLRTLAEAGVLANLRKFRHWGGRALGDEHLHHLADAPLLETLSLALSLPERPRLDILAGCPHLRDLELAHVEFDHRAPLLPPLPELTRLSLKGCQFAAGTLEALAGLPRLEQAELERLPPGGLGHLSRLPALRRLSVRFCQPLEARHLDHLANLPALEALDLPETGIADDASQSLARLSGLRILDLLGPPTTADLAPLARLTRLEWLRLPCGVEGQRLRFLAELPALFSLSLRDCTLDESDLGFLASLPALRQLSLRACRFPGAGLARLTRIESLDLDGAGQRGCGTPGAAPNSSPSRGTRTW
jgi:uncharacterized protein (TIGR02996 family)